MASARALVALIDACPARHPHGEQLLKSWVCGKIDDATVLGWDADDTDIDLWVTDPNGERAFYGHRLTYQGGRMSQDFTGGYGPEEFALRVAKPGRYKVQAQFYGHRQQVVAPATTLMLHTIIPAAASTRW